MNAKTLKHAVDSFFQIVKKKSYIPVEHYSDKDNLLKGKTAFISGGNGGIGFAIAKSFIESGANVILAGRNIETLKESVSELGGTTLVIYS